MSHEIVKPIDEVYCVEKAWHGLEILRPAGITGEDVKRLCPKLRQGIPSVVIDGITIPLGKADEETGEITSGYKLLVADYGECRPEAPESERFVPLHVPKASYAPISNCEIYETLKAGIGDAGKIVTAGTLGRGKRVFFTVQLHENETMSFKRANGVTDIFKRYKNFIGSHDGTLAVQDYDSATRIVCQNTLNFSLENAENCLKVYHTAGASRAMLKMAELTKAMIDGSRDFIGAMGELEQMQLSTSQARELATGYFALIGAKMNGGKVTALATRSTNAAEEITALFGRGKGNQGKTAYDLLNGATEYWTSGDGVGKKASDAKRISSATFGNGAEHKVRFAAMLRNDREAMREAGKEALSLC